MFFLNPSHKINSKQNLNFYDKIFKKSGCEFLILDLKPTGF